MSNAAPEDDDETLVASCQAGEREAFSLLVERHWKRLYGWLLAMTKSSHAAEDATQEAFCRAWANIGKYERGPGFRVWLFRIARNAWIERFRRTKKEQSGGVSSYEVPGKEAAPLDALVGQESEALVRQAILDLPVDFREALLLRTGEELSFSEVSAILQINEDTVRWRVHKARRLLLKKLARYLDGPDAP